jgi:hypothetical protein
MLHLGKWRFGALAEDSKIKTEEFTVRRDED